jgi:hypothetical protein
MLRALGVAAVLTVLALPGSASASGLRHCGNYDGSHWTNANDFGAGIHDVTSRVARCRTARKVALHGYRYGPGWWRGWQCRAVQSGWEFSDMRCTKRSGRVVRSQVVLRPPY